jgi:hypothetical protein
VTSSLAPFVDDSYNEANLIADVAGIVATVGASHGPDNA